MTGSRETNEYYRTVSVKGVSDRIRRDQELTERLAFDNKICKTFEDIEALLPDFTANKLGEIDSTKESFRKIASGYQKVSDVWLAMGRLLGIEDFSIEQCVLVVCANYLDSLKVRVEPCFDSASEPSRENIIRYYCMANPDFQGSIAFSGDKLILPENLFEAAVRMRLATYSLYFEVADLLVIPSTEEEEEEEESNMTINLREMTTLLPLKPTAATPEEEEEDESSDWGGGDEGEETDG